jgi:F-type H+-transporting ATPase subunit a
VPHGESWFSLLPFHGHLLELARERFGNADGFTWIAHAAPGVQHVYAGIFVLLLIGIVAVVTETSIREAGSDLLPPGTLTVRNFAELLVGAVYGMMSEMMGAKAARHFLPLIGTCAFFILISNALGLIPGFLPATDNLNTTLACGFVIFMATHIYGVKEHGLAYFKHFLGPVPWLAPLILPIEIVSHLARPVSLGVRLMANMTADHLVLGIFVGFLSWVTIWLPLPLPMYLLGTLVVIVQTLVFCLLSSVYISMAIEHAEH